MSHKLRIIVKKHKLLVVAPIFVAIFSLVYFTAIFQDDFQFQGKWELVPDYKSKVMSDNSMERFYSRFSGWDGQWYYHIAKNGYQCRYIGGQNNPYNCNVTFFPLLPKLGAVLYEVLSVPLHYSMQIINQAMLLGTMLVVLSYSLSKKKVSFSIGVLSILLFALYPGSIYFFTAYSEPILAFLLVSVFSLTFKAIESKNDISRVVVLIYMLFFSGIGERHRSDCFTCTSNSFMHKKIYFKTKC